MQYSKIALAVMLTAAATAVSATDIQIYGRVDAGLMFEDADGGERSLTMKSGGRTSSRLGFNIKEDLGNGNFVKVYLENGFKVDDGSFSTADTLFDRRAILAVQGAWGELGLGPAGTVQSTAAPYSMGSIKWDVFGTSYSNSSIGTTFANSSRVDNAINYVSPVMNNLKFGLSYSTGDKDDDDANEWQDKGHTFAAAMNYIGDNLFLGVTFANVDNKHPGGTAADGRAYQVGGWYRVVPTVRIFAGAGYQTAWSTGAKLDATKADPKQTWGGVGRASIGNKITMSQKLAQPVKAEARDVDGDGLKDMVFTFTQKGLAQNMLAGANYDIWLHTYVDGKRVAAMDTAFIETEGYKGPAKRTQNADL